MLPVVGRMQTLKGNAKIASGFSSPQEPTVVICISNPNPNRLALKGKRLELSSSSSLLYTQGRVKTIKQHTSNTQSCFLQ